jgi:hypothetical protein
VATVADETNNTQDLSGVLSDLLSNKELIAKISELGNTSPEEETKGDAVAQLPQSIDSLLSNSDIISKLPQMVGLLKPLLASTNTEKSNSQNANKHMALLMALKPYLSPKRCEAIDYFEKMSKISETFKGLKL